MLTAKQDGSEQSGAEQNGAEQNGGVSDVVAPNRVERNDTASDTFDLALKDETKDGDRASNFVLATIKPHGRGIKLEECFVTTSLKDNKGIAKGHQGEKKSNQFDFNLELNDRSLGEVYLENRKCLGKTDTSFKQKKVISFKIKPMPSAAVKKGQPFTLTVTIERKGSSPRTVTQSIVLTAKKMEWNQIE